MKHFNETERLLTDRVSHPIRQCLNMQAITGLVELMVKNAYPDPLLRSKD